MTARKKKGIAAIISGGMFVIGGVVMFTMPVTPLIIPILFQAAGLIAGAFGFIIVWPDTD